MKHQKSFSFCSGFFKTFAVFILMVSMSTAPVNAASSRPQRVKQIINTIGELEIPDSQKEKLKKIYTVMNFNEVMSGASEEALKIEKKAQVWAERVRLTSMFFFGKDIPVIDKLREYQDEMKKMKSIKGINRILGVSGKIVKIDSQLRSLYNNINQFQKDKNLPPSMRNALSVLWGTGRIINWLGGSVPIAGDIIQHYGNFLSGFSVIARKNYTFLSRKGPAGEINRYGDPVVKDFKGIPSETEIYLITNRKVHIIKDPNQPGKGGRTAYFIKLNGKWHKMSVAQYHSATSIISDWIAAFHEPDGGFWDWVSRKAYDLRKYLVGKQIRARNTYPTTDMVAQMIEYPKKKLTGLGLNRYELGWKAKQRLTDLADLRVMHTILGGVRNFNQITLKEFRRKRKWMAENFPKLGITLSPEKEKALLRMVFENNSRFLRAVRTEALRHHPGAKQLMKCRKEDPYTMHITTLADKLAEYRRSLPIERFRIIVKDNESGATLENVRISFAMTSPCTSMDLRGKPVIKRTGYNGSATFALPFGCYQMEVSRKGYLSKGTDKGFCLSEKSKKNTVVITLERSQKELVHRRTVKRDEPIGDPGEKEDVEVQDHSQKSREALPKTRKPTDAEILAEFRSLYPRYLEATKAEGANIKIIHNATPLGNKKYRVANEIWRKAEHGRNKGKMYRSASADWEMTLGELKALVIQYKKYFKSK